METGIHIGASQGTIEATSKAIMQILSMVGSNEQATIQKALSVLCEITRVPGPTTISGNMFDSGWGDIKPEVFEHLKAGWAKVTADESGKVEVSNLESNGVHDPTEPTKKRRKRK